MTPFVRLDAIAAPLPLSNVDTDKILPAKFLTTIKRAGLGKALFAFLREDPGFVLNTPPWDRAEILVTLENFGSGSSREHAPWALLDFGIRCIIAPNFADIFYNNCFKNGMLPIALPPDAIAKILATVSDPADARVQVDLPLQTVHTATDSHHFAIDARRKEDLLGGIDEIARSLSFGEHIDAFERRTARERPWTAPSEHAGSNRIDTSFSALHT